MKYSVSLKSNRDFRRLYSRGKQAVAPTMVLYTRKNRLKENRLGITTGKKLGNAVTRNRIRRRLREIYRLHEEEFLLGRDLVVVARVRSAFVSYQTLERDFLRRPSPPGFPPAAVSSPPARNMPERRWKNTALPVDPCWRRSAWPSVSPFIGRSA